MQRLYIPPHSYLLSVQHCINPNLAPSIQRSTFYLLLTCIKLKCYDTSTNLIKKCSVIFVFFSNNKYSTFFALFKETQAKLAFSSANFCLFLLTYHLHIIFKSDYKTSPYQVRDVLRQTYTFLPLFLPFC